ncbi:MAG: hypothetical protein LBF59_09455 [Prevotellaceae bacterium]|nr:hypothetical protein [Prevotellaceae bacterium]
MRTNVAAIRRTANNMVVSHQPNIVAFRHCERSDGLLYAAYNDEKPAFAIFPIDDILDNT